jgi:hypothetical protein
LRLALIVIKLWLNKAILRLVICSKQRVNLVLRRTPHTTTNLNGLMVVIIYILLENLISIRWNLQSWLDLSNNMMKKVLLARRLWLIICCWMPHNIHCYHFLRYFRFFSTVKNLWLHVCSYDIKLRRKMLWRNLILWAF